MEPHSVARREKTGGRRHPHPPAGMPIDFLLEPDRRVELEAYAVVD
ncbi:hypothetical protein [Cryobacterium sp. SO1]|nr:hypothetical protein [Cryobacterium sp. SO1]RZI34579.1 hypothetical protein BJQ95_03037 [Cryobacterium sp. SO1]